MEVKQPFTEELNAPQQIAAGHSRRTAGPLTVVNATRQANPCPSAQCALVLKDKGAAHGARSLRVPPVLESSPHFMDGTRRGRHANYLVGKMPAAARGGLVCLPLVEGSREGSPACYMGAKEKAVYGAIPTGVAEEPQ